MNHRVIISEEHGLTVEAWQPSLNNYGKLPFNLGILRHPVFIDEAAPLVLRTLLAIVDQFPQLVAFLREYCCPAISEIYAAAARGSEQIAAGESQLEELICARRLELNGKDGIIETVECFALGRADQNDFLCKHFGLSGQLIPYSLTGCQLNELLNIPVRILPTASVTLIDDQQKSHKFDLPSSLSLLKLLSSVYQELTWVSSAQLPQPEPDSIPSDQEELPRGSDTPRGSVTFSCPGSPEPRLTIPVQFSDEFISQLNDPSLAPDMRKALSHFVRDITGEEELSSCRE